MKIENPNPIQWQFSERAQQLQSSAIREILKITQRPEIISFAGGLPSPATFPVERMKAAYDKVLTENGKQALQYGPTDGYAPLREWIANSLSTEGSRILPEQILMVSGSQPWYWRRPLPSCCFRSRTPSSATSAGPACAPGWASAT